MHAHDMVEAPDEAYYRDRYWSWIEAELDSRGIDRSGVLLDAGCGTGRLTLLLAQHVAPDGGRVVAVDLMLESVEATRAYARSAGVENLELQASELAPFLAAQPDATFSAALFLEVGYVVLDLPLHLEELRRVLQPGGLLLASFRTQYFLALLGAARRDWETAREVLHSRSGSLRGIGWQNWHTAGDATAMLEKAGFSEVRLAGLGVLSGIAGGPLAGIARPSALASADLEALAEVETELGAAYPDSGRCLLASAVRTS